MQKYSFLCIETIFKVFNFFGFNFNLFQLNHDLFANEIQVLDGKQRKNLYKPGMMIENEYKKKTVPIYTLSLPVDFIIAIGLYSLFSSSIFAYIILVYSYTSCE